MRLTALPLWVMSVIGIAVIGTGCASPTPLRPGHVERATGEGSVVGGIDPCFGIPPSPSEPTYVAGTVTVYRGRVTWKPDRPGSFVAVLPSARVAEQTVATNATYRFVLEAGSYVLQAHYAGARFASPNAVVPFIGVMVSPGRVSAQSIPNECK
jgi:hypothetical protein